MAKIRPHPDEICKSRAQACIERYMRLQRMDVNSIAKQMCVSQTTVYNWIKHPESMKLGTLWQLSRVLKCSLGELSGGELPEELIGTWLRMSTERRTSH